MNHPYMKPVFVTYLAVVLLLALFGNKSEVYAEEVDNNVREVEKVYQLEMNRANYETIKYDILKSEVKYIALPEQLLIDVSRSEVLLENIDYTSFNEQLVAVTVNVYTDSKEHKQIVDQVKSNVKVKFTDTIAPTIELEETTVKQEEGNRFAAIEYLKDVTDNSFTPVDIAMDNNVDSTRPGEYRVIYTASDQSGNESSETLNVTITEKPKPVVQVQQRSQARAAAPRTVNRVQPRAASGNLVADTLSIINQYRAGLGYGPLQLASGPVQQAAAVRAAEASSYVSHTRPDGRGFKSAITDQGVNVGGVREVLVYSGSSPADKVAWWMGSGMHRSIIMNPNAKYIAIGIAGSMYAGLVY